ncbi:hypothetical protein LOAG_15408 [Loa loa]|uniref:Peptidase n=1 Tax=Loa loa TaxID=7209 RepID=A0A1I7W0Q9_LOALO|nr:hypothetical protein LOAG_15408 [Loa loa]EFO13122.1 hypothetical protein LOAG_15408 [Loa loa]
MSLKIFEAMNILFGIVAVAFAFAFVFVSTGAQRGGSKALGQGVFYPLNMSSSYDGNLTNFEWNVLKYMIHPKAATDMIFEASKIGFNKFMKNRDTYIYLPALIGVISAFLTVLLIVLLKSIFKRSHSLLRLIGIKQTSKQLGAKADDKAMLIQNKNLDHSMDKVLV